MQKLLVQSSESKLANIKLGPKLNQLLVSKILEIDGVFVLESLQTRSQVFRTAFPDLTDYECAVNHIHIEDFSAKKKQNQLELGVGFACKLKDKLQQEFPLKRFRIIVSYRMDDYLCSVRFHHVRENEIWIELDQLDEYEMEAILIFDI